MHLNRQKHGNETSSLTGSNGFSIVEVLITMLILSISLLGLAAMQNTSMRISYDAYLRTQATFISYDLIDRMRANSGIADKTGNILTNTSSTTEKICFTGDDCSASDLRNHDLHSWKTRIEELLPDATYTLAYDGGSNIYSINISWEDRKNDANDTGSTDTRQQFNYSFMVNN